VNTGQVIELAREWVQDHGNQTPGFLGAHLMGSLSSRPKEAPFPTYRDVDLNIVVKGASANEPRDIPFHSLWVSLDQL
jgi:hypothetical protein